MKAFRLLYIGFAVVVGLVTTRVAQAGLVLTPAGVADGFSLSVFASGIPNNGTLGPMGITTTSSGNVLVTDFGGFPTSTFSWTDLDGQTPGSALADSSVGIAHFGITTAQGKIYAVDFGAGNINLLNNDGSFNSVFLALPGGTNGGGNGIATDPVNGHIYVDSANGINDIDPVTKAVRHVNGVLGDGITVSPDGKTVYLSTGGTIVGYDTTTGAATGFSVSIVGADGVAVIQGGSIFNNYLVVNTNGGLVDLVDPTGAVVTTIANGGSRGDFVGVDLNNGTLFLSQTDSVDRLSCGPGCQFVPVASPTITKAFLPTSITTGGTSVVTLTLSNSNASVPTGGAFTDKLVNMSAAGGIVGGTCVGTTPGTLGAGATALSFTGITIPANGSCTVTFGVTSSTTGGNNNQTSGVTTTQTPTAGAISNIATLTVTILVGGPSFQISYAANLSVGDSFVDITNVGTLGASLQSGTTASITGAICANVYAFTPDEQLVSCCSCPVTPNGLVSLSAKNDLASNTLTPAVPAALVIKVLATVPVAGSCNNSAAAVTTATLAPGMQTFGSTIHATPAAGIYGVTERPFSGATLSAGELSRLGNLCNFILANGSGFGICRSCRLGGLGSERQ